MNPCQASNSLRTMAKKGQDSITSDPKIWLKNKKMFLFYFPNKNTAGDFSNRQKKITLQICGFFFWWKKQRFKDRDRDTCWVDPDRCTAAELGIHPSICTEPAVILLLFLDRPWPTDVKSENRLTSINEHLTLIKLHKANIFIGQNIEEITIRSTHTCIAYTNLLPDSVELWLRNSEGALRRNLRSGLVIT